MRILIWDVPTRVFHWSLVISFFGAYLTAESEKYRDIHVMLGYTLAGLLIFRIIWGLCGSRYARFRSFLFKPTEVLQYAKSMLSGNPLHHLGHNPLGSIAIYLLLSLGFGLAVTGVMLLENIGGEWVEELHEMLTDTMLVVVAIHFCGVVVSSLLHRENLARAMLTGYKSGERTAGISNSHWKLGVLLLCAVLSFWAIYPQINTPDIHAPSTQSEQED